MGNSWVTPEGPVGPTATAPVGRSGGWARGTLTSLRCLHMAHGLCRRTRVLPSMRRQSWFTCWHGWIPVRCATSKPSLRRGGSAQTRWARPWPHHVKRRGSRTLRASSTCMPRNTTSSRSRPTSPEPLIGAEELLRVVAVPRPAPASAAPSAPVRTAHQPWRWRFCRGPPRWSMCGRPEGLRGRGRPGWVPQVRIGPSPFSVGLARLEGRQTGALQATSGTPRGSPGGKAWENVYTPPRSLPGVVCPFGAILEP